jgi:hypothetical protein
MNFGDVLNAVWDFFSAHPTETVIMSVKEEYDATNSTNTFEQTFDSYVAQNPGGWYLGAGVPTLDQVRGKIVLLRRFGASSVPKGLDGSSWPDNQTFTIDNGSAVIGVQDSYNVSDNNAKWTSITSQYSSAQSSSPTELFVNFSSGVRTYAFGFPNILIVSNFINPRLSSYFQSNTAGRFGITPMDFVDSSRASLIYSTNFSGIGPVPTGIYKVLNSNSGKALDVASSSTSDGAQIDQWTDNGGNNQRWLFTNQGGGYYQIAALHSGKALDDPGSSANAGTAMNQWSTNGTAAQKWQVLANEDGTYRIINASSGLALDVAGGSTSDGASVIQWDWVGGNNQRWDIVAP